MMILGIVVLAAIVLVALGYNRLVTMRNMVRNAWSDIDVQLRRRSDLIPSLVEAVKGYAAHESRLFEDVAEARSRAERADLGPEERETAERELGRRVAKIVALAESYPELKASGQFLQLQQQLSAVEDDLASARRYYNGITADYNAMLQSVPTNLIAGPLGFGSRPLFAVNDDVRATPQVEFQA